MNTITFHQRLIVLLLFGGQCAQAQGWDTLGVGFAAGPSGLPRVRDIAEFQGDLYAGGFFTALEDGTPMNYLSRWDGVSWVSLGTGMNEMVRRIQPFDSLLYIGGKFTQANGMPANYIASWDGSKFDTLQGGLNGDVKAMTVFDNKLIVAGDFTQAGGLPANYIASWDGSKFDTLQGGLNGDVKAMTVFDNKLIVAGDFTQAGGLPANYIASWDGSQWDTLGTGLVNKVLALGTWGGELYAGGKDPILSGDKMAKWNGTAWTTLPLLTHDIINVHDFLEFEGQLVACGNWNIIGAVLAPGVASFDGSSWAALGSGLNGETTDLEIYNGQLYAAGHFTSSGGTLLKVGRYDGMQWRDLQNGLASGVGAGMAFWPYNEKLYFVGDNFTQIGIPSVPAKRVAVWDICPYYTASITTSPSTLDLALDSTVNFWAGTDDGGGATSWNWDFGDGTTDSIQFPVHSFSVPDTYAVSLVVSNGFCADTAVIEYVVELSTAVEGQGSVDAVIRQFPNPIQNEFILEFSPALRETDLVFVLFDMTGKEVFRSARLSFPEARVRPTEVSPGTYLYQVRSATGRLQGGRIVISE